MSYRISVSLPSLDEKLWGVSKATASIEMLIDDLEIFKTRLKHVEPEELYTSDTQFIDSVIAWLKVKRMYIRVSNNLE